MEELNSSASVVHFCLGLANVSVLLPMEYLKLLFPAWRFFVSEPRETPLHLCVFSLFQQSHRVGSGAKKKSSEPRFWMGGVIGSAPSFTDVWAHNLCKGFRNPFLTSFKRKKNDSISVKIVTIIGRPVALKISDSRQPKQIILPENKDEGATKKAPPPHSFIAAKQKHVDLS